MGHLVYSEKEQQAPFNSAWQVKARWLDASVNKLLTNFYQNLPAKYVSSNQRIGHQHTSSWKTVTAARGVWVVDTRQWCHFWCDAQQNGWVNGFWVTTTTGSQGKLVEIRPQCGITIAQVNISYTKPYSTTSLVSNSFWFVDRIKDEYDLMWAGPLKLDYCQIVPLHFEHV